MSLKYPTTSKTLLDKIASGDEISWDEFYQKYSPVVKAVAQYRGLRAADAEDICQQVMMQFFKQSKTFRFDPDIARFRTYFGLIIQSKISDFYRKKREISVDELPAVPVDTESEMLFMTEWRKVVIKEIEAKLKLRVNNDTFQAYELYVIQERPVKEVAEFLICSENQVYQAKKRCLAVMHEIALEMNKKDPGLQLELSAHGI